MTTMSADDTIVQEITIEAPARRVFEALTDPEQRKEWWGSEGRFQTTLMESDLRVGGKWRMSGTGFGTVVLHIAPESAVGGPLAGGGHYAVLFAVSAVLFVPLTAVSAASRRIYLRTRRGR